MPILDNPRHEKFAQAVADGMSQVDAYRKVYGNKKSARNSAADLFADCPCISVRISELQCKSELKAEITREELLGIMVKTVRAKPIEAGMYNPLCELKMSKAGPYAAFIDKSNAAERICKMLGWDAPQKHEINDVTQREPIDQLRERVTSALDRHARC